MRIKKVLPIFINKIRRKTGIRGPYFFSIDIAAYNPATFFVLPLVNSSLSTTFQKKLLLWKNLHEQLQKFEEKNKVN